MIENRAIALGRGWIPWAVTLVGVMGLLVEMLEPVAGQPNPPQQSSQSAELSEASRLNQQVEQLLKENLYSAAIPISAAVPLAERALAIREKVLGSKHPDVATSLNNLAQLYYYQGNNKQAEPLYQRALAIREKVLGSKHPDVATSLFNLARLYSDQFKYKQAELLYQRALAIREKVLGPEHRDVATSLFNLAMLYQEQGNYKQAEPLYQRALAIREKVLEPEHNDIATSLNRVAQVYHYLGNYKQAEPLYQRAVAIWEKALGPEHHFVPLGLSNLASLYQEQGNYKQAELLYQRVLAIWEKVLDPEHPYIALGLSNLASLYRDQGNYKQAEPLYQRAFAIREKIYEPEHPRIADSFSDLAALYQVQGNYKEAESLRQRALAIREKVYGPEHPDVAHSLYKLALLYWASGDIARAIEFLTRGTNILEHNLAINLTTGSEAQKRAYIATLSGVADATVSLHVEAAPKNPQAARLALTTILQRKGRVLDALTDSLQALRQRLSPEDQSLLDKLAFTRSQLAALIFKGSENTPPDQYRKQLTTLEDQAQELEANLSRRSAEFRTESQPVTIEAVQKLIPSDAALVELVLYYPLNPKAATPAEAWGVPRYVAYVLHRQGNPKWVDLGEAETINKAVGDFRQAIRDRQQSPTKVKKVARTLDAKLMQPIRQRLGNTRTVLLSPDSQLNLIPFAALVDEKNQYFLENYSITYLTSGRDLLRLQAPSPSKQVPFLLANPDFDNSQSPGSVQQAQASRSSDNHRSTDLAELKYGPLEGTAQEAKAIAPMLPGVKLLTGSQATENALKELHGPNILHIATHGFFLEDEPTVLPSNTDGSVVESRPGVRPNSAATSSENPLLRSGLVLAGFNLRSSGSEDGVLTAFEAAGLDLRGTKLVVLSACETGVGDVANGEGVYGLRRAFAIAGSESQLISLWNVDDIGTKDLMVGYYQRLRNNVGRSEALRQTQLEMLHSQDYQHPFFWAAFIASGDWTSMGADALKQVASSQVRSRKYPRLKLGALHCGRFVPRTTVFRHNSFF